MDRRVHPIILILSLTFVAHLPATAQNRTLPAQYRHSGQRMYLKRLQTHLQTIRPRGEQMLQQPMRNGGSFTPRTSNNTTLQRAQLQRRIRNAGHVQPRMFRPSASNSSAYQRANYARSMRLRSRTVMNTPPPRRPRAYNRSLSTYAR